MHLGNKYLSSGRGKEEHQQKTKNSGRTERKRKKERMAVNPKRELLLWGCGEKKKNQTNYKLEKKKHKKRSENKKKQKKNSTDQDEESLRKKERESQSVTPSSLFFIILFHRLLTKSLTRASQFSTCLCALQHRVAVALHSDINSKSSMVTSSEDSPYAITLSNISLD